jgi:hypothetical protein
MPAHSRDNLTVVTVRIQGERFRWGCPMEERRKETRRRTFKAGKIMIDGKSIIDCKVRNLTYRGACLEVGSPVGITDTFELSIPVDNLTRKCRVRWRKSNQIGIFFI